MNRTSQAERRLQAMQAVLSGRSVKEVALEFDLSEGYLRQLCIINHIPCSPKKVLDRQRGRLALIDLQRGEHPADVAEKHGISLSYCYHLCAANSIDYERRKRGRKNYPPADPERLRLLQQFGEGNMTTKEILDALGVSKQRVYQLMKRNGIVTGKLREGKKLINRISPEDLTAMKNGERSIRSVANENGFGYTSLHSSLRSNGIHVKRAMAPFTTGAPRRFTLERFDINDLICGGTSIKKLAKKYRCSTATVTNCLRRQDVRVSKIRSDAFNLPDEDKAAILERRMTIHHCAAKNGVSRHTIKNALRRDGIDLVEHFRNLGVCR